MLAVGADGDGAAASLEVNGIVLFQQDVVGKNLAVILNGDVIFIGYVVDEFCFVQANNQAAAFDAGAGGGV